MSCRLFLAPLLLAVSAHATDYGYRILERKPQPRDLFVQGLEFHGDYLYVSTGRYGLSSLLRYRFAEGSPPQGLRLPTQLWGEGLTLLGEDVYQLTWKARRLLVFHRESLDFRRQVSLPGQGWGLTNNGRELVYTDGSDLLHYLDPASGERLGSVAVRDNGRPLPCLNELEWIDGRIWANVWTSDHIVMINPYTGEVEGRVDLAGLLPDDERVPGTDVLNGIARNPADGAVWVTGKLWPWLYRIELQPAAPPPLSPPEGPIQYNQDPQPQQCVPFQYPTETPNE